MRIKDYQNKEIIETYPKSAASIYLLGNKSSGKGVWQKVGKVHDKVVHRPMTQMYNLRRILQHIVYGFDNVSLAQHHSYHYGTKKVIKLVDWLSR